MEDASVIALRISQWSEAELKAVLDQLVDTAEEVASLLAAGHALSE